MGHCKLWKTGHDSGAAFGVWRGVWTHGEAEPVLEREFASDMRGRDDLDAIADREFGALVAETQPQVGERFTCVWFFPGESRAHFRTITA